MDLGFVMSSVAVLWANPNNRNCKSFNYQCASVPTLQAPDNQLAGIKQRPSRFVSMVQPHILNRISVTHKYYIEFLEINIFRMNEKMPLPSSTYAKSVLATRLAMSLGFITAVVGYLPIVFSSSDSSDGIGNYSVIQILVF
jgi:hypothetical protein